MTYQILFKEPAKRAIDDLDRGVRMRVFRALQRLAATPSLGKPLRGPLAGLWSYRVGDWRVVYELHERRITIIVVAVGHRREIYEAVTKALRQLRS